MGVTLPIEIYEAFEKTLGKEDAKAVVKGLEATISDNAEYKWKTTKEELLNDLEKRFATKADLQLVETRLESKMRLHFFIILFVIILTNPRALDLIAKLLGLAK
ncbi:MAG: hypothetical protein HQK92_14165 [Nitrospirae bacterium]|nr:hypothetical protein [Nitrospirota bacterium]